jgi:hypothetical protein
MATQIARRESVHHQHPRARLQVRGLNQSIETPELSEKAFGTLRARAGFRATEAANFYSNLDTKEITHD